MDALLRPEWPRASATNGHISRLRGGRRIGDEGVNSVLVVFVVCGAVPLVRAAGCGTANGPRIRAESSAHHCWKGNRGFASQSPEKLLVPWRVEAGVIPVEDVSAAASRPSNGARRAQRTPTVGSNGPTGISQRTARCRSPVSATRGVCRSWQGIVSIPLRGQSLPFSRSGQLQGF